MSEVTLSAEYPLVSSMKLKRDARLGVRSVFSDKSPSECFTPHTARLEPRECAFLAFSPTLIQSHQTRSQQPAARAYTGDLLVNKTHEGMFE
jgi:hypothetical protein